MYNKLFDTAEYIDVYVSPYNTVHLQRYFCLDIAEDTCARDARA